MSNRIEFLRSFFDEKKIFVPQTVIEELHNALIKFGESDIPFLAAMNHAFAKPVTFASEGYDPNVHNVIVTEVRYEALQGVGYPVTAFSGAVPVSGVGYAVEIQDAPIK